MGPGGPSPLRSQPRRWAPRVRGAGGQGTGGQGDTAVGLLLTLCLCHSHHARLQNAHEALAGNAD